MPTRTRPTLPIVNASERHRLNTRLPWVLAVALAVLLVTTQSLSAKVKVFPSKKYKVSYYKTYEWLPTRIMTRQGILEDDPHIAPLIKAAVKSWLDKKGYVEVTEGAELHVLTGALQKTNSQLEGFLINYGFDYFWGMTTATVTPVQRVNRRGTLIVGLINAKTEEGVWIGFSTEGLGAPKDAPKIIQKASSRLMKKLPKSKR